MRTCPKCKSEYADETLNFCLSDGSMLVFDNEEETVIRLKGSNRKPSRGEGDGTLEGSFEQSVIVRVREIESLLVHNFGAEGRGLHEKLSSVEAKLPAHLAKKVRRIATVRNKLIHEDSFKFDDNPELFLLDCEYAISFLAISAQVQQSADESLHRIRKSASMVTTSSREPLPTSPRPRVEVVFDLIGRAHKTADPESSGYNLWDSPPHSTSVRYPYRFELSNQADCFLTGSLSIWASQSHLQNVVEVFVDSDLVETIRVSRSDDFRLETKLRSLTMGVHEISFDAHFEAEGHIVESENNRAPHYWLLRWLKVTAYYDLPPT